MPKLKEDFYVVVPGKIYPETIPAGTAVDGELAEIAAACGKIDRLSGPARNGRARKAPENQAQSGAPEIK
ncbi:hypothetical protein [Paracoccus sulfuroxidans]|uniref:hypothetical protein n=1 Tax=Paracoccus sulfuroxidans TaxID=384678 RepID=UPI0011A2942B|nr:hypothetical protein [Paracoccus sulfuroxidans]